MDFERRFGGLARLYGEPGLRRLAAADVCVIGVGGVGSWAVEALARSAVGRITLIDMDHVAESNMNRQLPALEDTLGRSKIEVLAERVRTINPDCELRLRDEFVSVETWREQVSEDHDWVMDCVDNFRIKAALIAGCKRRGQSLITVGGAGGQRDPTRVQVSDLRRTEQDPLLAQTRKLLRREYGFSANPKRRFRVPCVWSGEPQHNADTGCDTTPQGSLNCAGFGACMPVTAAFGMAAAGWVIERLAASATDD